MSYYWICEACGASLDPGEKCDCSRENQKTPEPAKTKGGRGMQENSLKTNIIKLRFIRNGQPQGREYTYQRGGRSGMNNRIKKKPLQLRRSIRAGIGIGVLVLTAMTTVEIARQAWETYQSRTGAPGGEILVLPMMILLFYTGWTARGEWIDFKRAFREAERREYHASNSPAYKG